MRVWIQSGEIKVCFAFDERPPSTTRTTKTVRSREHSVGVAMGTNEKSGAAKCHPPDTSARPSRFQLPGPRPPALTVFVHATSQTLPQTAVLALITMRFVHDARAGARLATVNQAAANGTLEESRASVARCKQQTKIIRLRNGRGRTQDSVVFSAAQKCLIRKRSLQFNLPAHISTHGTANGR